MKRWLAQGILGASFIGLALIIAIRLSPKPALLDGVAFSPVVTDRNGRLLRVGLATDDAYREFVPLERISSRLIEATLLYEDRYFYQHAGYNPVALARAFWNELRPAGRRIGASTITMQVARMRGHLNTRTWGGKLRQIVLAARLECFYSKREILEAYFNLAPYGRNIEGVGAASRIYFGKAATDLTLLESLTLSVVPQNPTRRFPGAKDPAALTEARAILFTEWVRQHPGDADKRIVLGMPLQVRSQTESPFHAPHFVEECVRTETADRGQFTTTLDLDWQQLFERQIGRFIEENRRRGIENAVALLVDYTTMEVLASVGSADYSNATIQGQVNGAEMKRSPGSALKPFVYALALDQGIIQPHSLLKDAPTSFNGYNPENFDRDFMGPVQAVDALVQSRNVPAVDLASRLKEHSLYTLLTQGGVGGLKPESSYGLTIPLGGAEVSPEELARLYAMLANHGVDRPLRRRTVEARTEGKRMLSPEAAFLVLDMLRHNPPLSAVNTVPVAWKTGTSYSFRDAWTAGVFGRYVLVTWVGNFDGKPNPAFVGRSAAAPLFFSLMTALVNQSPRSVALAPWEKAQGLKLTQVDLCALTGELATDCCTHRITGWFIPGLSPLTTCAVHQEIWIDPHTGYRVTAAEAGSGARREIWEVWPSDLAALFRFAGLSRREPPAFAPSSRIAGGTDGAPQILSPRQGIDYTIRVSGGEQTIPLQAEASVATAQIYWFADKTYLGRSNPGESLLWKAPPGAFRIVAVDDSGRQSERRLRVVAVP